VAEAREAALPGAPGAALGSLGSVSARRSRGRASERALVRAAQDGSAEAMEELFRRFWPGAHRAAWLVVRDAAAAEDVAQEAFLAAVRALDRFDRRRPFGPWLHRIVVNRAIDYARAREGRREVAAFEAFGAKLPCSAPPAGGLPSGELLAALGRLAPEQRAVVVLRHLLGYTPGEIARMLGLPRGTVNSRLRRGLDALASCMRAAPGTDGHREEAGRS
jgi:RNA polymerase sigma-70 factor, ECF subfamily